ncbi:MAG: HNH endonuclease [Methylomicrobium sp.]
MKKSIRKFRHKAFIRQNRRCFYCNHPIWLQNSQQFAESFGISLKAATLLQCTAEHLRALSAGGNNCSSNIVAACRFCNQTRHKAKKVKSPSEYAFHVQRRVQANRWFPWRVSAAS